MSEGTAAEDFAALLGELKERSGLSYGALARRLHMSTSTLHRYCNGDAVPTDYAPVERLARLCKASRDELVELHRRWVLADAVRRRKGAGASGASSGPRPVEGETAGTEPRRPAPAAGAAQAGSPAGRAGVEGAGAAGPEEPGVAGLEDLRGADPYEPGAAGREKLRGADPNEPGAAGLEERPVATPEKPGAVGPEQSRVAGPHDPGSAGRDGPGVAGPEDLRGADPYESGPAGAHDPGPAGREEPGKAGLNESGPASAHDPGPAGREKPGRAGLNESGVAGLNDPGVAGPNPPDVPGPEAPGTAGPEAPGTPGPEAPGTAGPRQSPARRRARRRIAAVGAVAVAAVVGAVTLAMSPPSGEADGGGRSRAAESPDGGSGDVLRSTAPSPSAHGSGKASGKKPGEASGKRPDRAAAQAGPSATARARAGGDGGSGAGGSAAGTEPHAQAAPLRVTAQPHAWESACGQRYLVNQPPDRVPPPPYEQTAPAWVARVGAVPSGEQYVELTVQGTGKETVVVRKLSVRVVARHAPLAWNDYVMGHPGVGCGGGVPTRSFTVALDAQRPALVPEAGEKNGPFKVSESDPEVYYIRADASAYDVSWVVDVQWSSGSRSGTLEVRPDGRPFRTSGNHGRPAYEFPLGGDKWVEEGSTLKSWESSSTANR
ncbi:helix-turn-helix domain-containing protein [Streptomyces sp. NPDC052682]|uniref:helix-turn-helix domain-containing protein n=1 Tax=Streptomyces sp. NPDC052682 TaxID=3154954 RepID=UPI0034206224